MASLAVRANGDLLRKTSSGLRVMLGTDALEFPGSRHHGGTAVVRAFPWLLPYNTKGKGIGQSKAALFGYAGLRELSDCIQVNREGPGHKAVKDVEGGLHGEPDEAHASSYRKEAHSGGAPADLPKLVHIPARTPAALPASALGTLQLG